MSGLTQPIDSLQTLLSTRICDLFLFQTGQNKATLSFLPNPKICKAYDIIQPLFGINGAFETIKTTLFKPLCRN